MMIHGICHSSQPYVTFYCDKTTDHYVSFQSDNLPDDVHEADIADTARGLYSFSNSLVNCPGCLKVIEEDKNK